MLVEALLFLLLLSLGADKRPGIEDSSLTVVDLAATDAAQDAPEQESAARDEPPAPQAQPDEATPPPQPSPPAPPLPRPAQVQPVPPAPAPPAPRPPVEAQPESPRPAPAAPRRSYGPPDKGASPMMRDSEIVGTAPNGEPLYAAAWYREPRPDQLRAYLSTASGPGWGLIACRTAPNYRVEDCVGLSEYPQGSQITRAVLAAAWEFKVLPPRRGGKTLVGSWVRIRIDYGIDRR